MLGNNGVLIYPSFISSAPYPHEIMYNTCNFTYLMIFNALGLPVTQCPLGFDKNRLPIGLQVRKIQHSASKGRVVVKDVGYLAGLIAVE